MSATFVAKTPTCLENNKPLIGVHNVRSAVAEDFHGGVLIFEVEQRVAHEVLVVLWISL